ncbi:MAG TPA: VOC family protein, partial [Ilumatobacteraceae bacterium]|nr:VOC family protein [Ilumatobacteraceae bacterium]
GTGLIGRLGEIVIDCHDPVSLAQFWQKLLGGYVVRQSHEWVSLEPPAGLTVAFQLVPEDKVAKNRVHLDVDVHDLADATAAAEAAGATRVGEVVYDELGGFQVMADPEGNEFCLVHGPTAITA